MEGARLRKVEPAPVPDAYALGHLRASTEEELSRRRVLAEVKALVYEKAVSAFSALWDLPPEDRRAAVASVAAELRIDAQGGEPEMGRAVAEEIVAELEALGPLADLLNDPSLNEIMVNRFDEIWVERRGRLLRMKRAFADDAALERTILGLARGADALLGRDRPYADFRLSDGSRVHAILPPVSVRGPMLTVRKFSPHMISVSDLLKAGTLTPSAATFLQAAVQTRRSILVSGGTSTGKTTLLNVLSGFIPEGERLVVIEDTSELKMAQKNIGRLEARVGGKGGEGRVTMRELVVNALRMRPDRIVVGEVRGPEALEMLQAMNTGHEGSMGTIHANSPGGALARLELLLSLADATMPAHVMRSQIASSVNLIVQLARFADGARRVVSVVELTGMMGEVIQRQEIFTFRRAGLGEDGAVRGRLRPTGLIPKFYSELREEGTVLSYEIFE